MSLPAVKLVILVGGPSKGTRFRPLSLDIPKPLFPIVDKPLVWHHVSASVTSLKSVATLKEVLLIGFYDGNTPLWKDFTQALQKEFQIPVLYLQENARTGTAGGLNKFRGQICEGNPDYFFLEHCDVVCTFPLAPMLEQHKATGKDVTILGKRMDKSERYGCLVVDPQTNEVLHYAEKPETHVSEIINCGVYVFSTNPFFTAVDRALQTMKRESDQHPEYLQLEQDILMRISHNHAVNCFETKDFWLQLKSPGTVLKASEHFMRVNAGSLKFAQNGQGFQVVGNVIVDPTATIDPTAKLGPNVAIGPKVVVGAGVRIANSFILDNSEIRERTCVLYSVVGWNCIVGKWCRLEGVPDFSQEGDERSNGITILGTGVVAANETVVRSSIVLPHKELSGNYANQILL